MDRLASKPTTEYADSTVASGFEAKAEKMTPGSDGHVGISLRSKGIIAFTGLVVYVLLVALVINTDRVQLLSLVGQLESTHRNEEQLIQINMSVARAILTVNENFATEDLASSAMPIMIELEGVAAALGTLQGQHPRLVILAHALEALAADMSKSPGRGLLAVSRSTLHDLVGELDEITQRERQLKLSLLGQYQGTHEKVSLKGTALSLIGMIVLGAVTSYFFSRLTLDISSLETRAREVVRGYRGEPLEVTRSDEIGGLMHAINAMQSDLRARETQLELVRQQDFHREKMAAIGSLAAAVAHEINNPIQAIAGVAQSIRDVRSVHHCPTTGVVCRPELILEQAQRVAVITRQIADFSVTRPREPALTDVNGLVRSMCNLIVYDKRFRGVTVDTDLAADLPAIRIVGDHVTQVLMNVMINAADALENIEGRTRRILVESVPLDRAIRIVVTDSGEGMDPATLACVFDEFYTTKPAGKGNGIGLALCKQIVEAAGGTIRIESTLGTGTRVEVELPLRAPEAVAA